MRGYIATIGLAILMSASTAQSQALPPAAQEDLQCFVLYSIAVAEAKDERVKQAASLGTIYFVGKLQVRAPGLDLARAVRQEASAMEGNPDVKEIGAACDSEFSRRGEELMSLGQELQGSEP